MAVDRTAWREEFMELSSLTVQVPTARLQEVYTFVAGLFESDPDRLTEWERSNTMIAKKVYESLTPIAREIYDQLFEISDSGLTLHELAQKTHKNPSQISGVFSWPSAHAKNYGKLPIHLQHPDGKVFVTAKVAQIFNEALGRK
jgi:hypothetical protein